MHDYSIFKIGEAFNFIHKIYDKVKDGITGELAGVSWDYGVVAQAIYNSGGGNYLEIGTLFGGGAILMGLLYKEFNLNGEIYVLDPLNGYYGKNNSYNGVVPSVEIVRENARKFGVKINIIDKKSYPFPEKLRNIEFAVSLIDGDHWNGMPTRDFISVNNITSNYIIFDNYDLYHPSVKEAVEFAIKNTEWRPVHISSISCVLGKPHIIDKFGRERHEISN